MSEELKKTDIKKIAGRGCLVVAGILFLLFLCRYNQIKKEHADSNIGIATVYRALSFLEEVDLITSITFGTDGKKYESNSKSHHDHLICTTCGKIVEFMDDDIEKRQDKIAKKNNFKISSHSMQLYGICENCQK